MILIQVILKSQQQNFFFFEKLKKIFHTLPHLNVKYQYQEGRVSSFSTPLSYATMMHMGFFSKYITSSFY